MLAVLIYQSGPLTRAELAEQVNLDDDALDEALRQLIDDGRIAPAADGSYSGVSYAIGMDGTEGWEAAVFDHYQAVVSTVIQRLRAATRQATYGDRIGGSTYTFDLWDGHPNTEPIMTLLERARSAAAEARTAATSVPIPEGAELTRVTFYVGQNMKGGDGTDEG